MNIEADTHKAAAEKHQQLGAPAMRQIWKSLLTPLQKGGQDSMVLVDLTPQTADALVGFLRVRQSLDLPTFYFGHCQNASHKEWIQEYLPECTKHDFLNGELLLHIPPMPTEPSATTSTSIAAPQLTVLSWSQDKKTVVVPATVLTKWSSNPEMEVQLQEQLNSLGSQ